MHIITKPRLYSIVESPTHPHFGELYQQLGFEETCFRNMRKVMLMIKKQPPDFIVAEFFYGYANNYAGVNISNLDVLLFALQKYAKKAKVIVFVDKKEAQYVDKLNLIFKLHHVFVKPVSVQQIKPYLGTCTK